MTSPPFHYIHRSNFPELLESSGISLFISTYQAGKLMVVRSQQQRLITLLRNFEQMMGLALQPHRLAIGTRHQIYFFRNAPEIAPHVEPGTEYDACFLPRTSHITGDIRVRELAWVGDELWIVNTRFSCLCTLSPDYSFVPRWKPPFISRIEAEDRCHLNGLAVVDDRPKYVTAFARTDTPRGWYETKATSGCIMDVPSGEVVAQGFSMPHSPRVYDDRLWLLDSGNGTLVVVEPETGDCTVVAQLPGFTRGLAFYGRYAFVGVSQIREKRIFGGLPIEEKCDRLQCGVWAIDIDTGKRVSFLEFRSGCTELFDVQVLSQFDRPNVIGVQKDTIDRIFIFEPKFIDRSIK